MIRHSRSFTCSRRSDPDLIYQQLAERSLANKDRILFCGSQNSVDFFNQYTFILRVAVTILGHTCSPHTHIKVRETLRYRTRLPVSTLYHLQCRCPCSSNEAEPNALLRHSFASERDSRGIASKDRLPKRRKSISQPCDNPCLSHSITHGERTICATQRLKRLTPVSKHISIFQDWPVCSLPCTSMWISFIILLHLLPCCLSRVATNLPVLTMQAPVRSDVELHESGTMTKYSLNFSHPTTTVPSFPCRHRFRNDVETSALLAENIIVGWPMQMYRRTLGPLYNISLYVTEVLKKPKRSIFPVQEQQLLRIGQFSEYPDPGRCLLNVKMNKEYIFFIRRPDWAGFCQVTQLPVEYTEEAALRVAKMLMLGAHPLQMRPLYHADQLEVDEGNDLLLTCRVRGRPTPLISWYHNETEITAPWKSGLRRGIIQNSRNLSKLQLGNLQASDAGNYTCLAENLNGHIRKSVKVIVTPLNTTPATTTTATTTKPKILVHPCHDYCYRGLCYIIDEKPYCRCEPLHFGERCEKPRCTTHYHGTRCTIYTPYKDELWVERAGDKRIKGWSGCENGCDSSVLRVVLTSSSIALILLLLMSFVIYFVLHSRFKRRFSSKCKSPGEPDDFDPIPSLPNATTNVGQTLCRPTVLLSSLERSLHCHHGGSMETSEMAYRKCIDRAREKTMPQANDNTVSVVQMVSENSLVKTRSTPSVFSNLHATNSGKTQVIATTPSISSSFGTKPLAFKCNSELFFTDNSSRLSSLFIKSLGKRNYWYSSNSWKRLLESKMKHASFIPYERAAEINVYDPLCLASSAQKAKTGKPIHSTQLVNWNNDLAIQNLSEPLQLSPFDACHQCSDTVKIRCTHIRGVCSRQDMHKLPNSKDFH